tara:strand:+ start:218 stop:1024 length:807 start_codon:yes stop_codon:yes gene_type:complete
MKYSTILIIWFSLFGNLSGSWEQGRLSIIPEYDQNHITILFSAVRSSTFLEDEIRFSVPDNVDSVAYIKKRDDGKLEFILYPTYKDSGLNWAKIRLEAREFAFMINTQKFNNFGNRDFNYEISFSHPITDLFLEIQEPLAATNFSYSGFTGKKNIDENGISTYSTNLVDILPNENIMVALSYNNIRGETTQNILSELTLKSEEESSIKINRHKLYIWEPIITIGVISLFTIFIMIFIENNSLKLDYCSNCSQRIKDKSNYCPKCGEKL